MYTPREKYTNYIGKYNHNMIQFMVKYIDLGIVYNNTKFNISLDKEN